MSYLFMKKEKWLAVFNQAPRRGRDCGLSPFPSLHVLLQSLFDASQVRSVLSFSCCLRTLAEFEGSYSLLADRTVDIMQPIQML